MNIFQFQLFINRHHFLIVLTEYVIQAASCFPPNAFVVASKCK